MPSATDLIPGTSMGDFKSFDSVKMTAEIDNVESGTTVACDNADKCEISYSWEYTPICYHMSPPVVYPGQKTNIYINPMNAPNYKKSDDLPIHIKLDGTRLDMSEYMDEGSKLANSKVQYVRGTVMTEQRNENVDLSVWFRGAGSCLKNAASSDTCDVNGNCYSQRIMPTVSSVSAAAGYTSGGQEITITGTSLDGKSVDIIVGDVPCEISSVTASSVVCQTKESDRRVLQDAESQPTYG